MLYLIYALFIIGLISYLISTFFIGNITGETLAHIGSGLFLMTIALLLFEIVKKKDNKGNDG